MRKSITAALLAGFATGAAALTIAAPAQARDFEAEFSRPVTAPITAVEVTVDPEIIARQTPGRRNLISRHTIGPKDAERVSEQVAKVLTRRLVDQPDTPLSGEAGATLKVVVTQVLATDLRFTEYGVANNLALGSRQAGGAAFLATLVSADGVPVATFAYDRFEPFLGFSSLGVGTWYDATRAAQFFASRVDEAIEESAPTF